MIDRWPRAILHAPASCAEDVTLWQRAARLDMRVLGERPDGDAFAKRVAEATSWQAQQQLRAREVAPQEVPAPYYQGRYTDSVVAAAIVGWGGYGMDWFHNWMTKESVRGAALRKIQTSPEAAALGLTRLTEPFRSLLRSMPRGRGGEPSQTSVRFAVALMTHKPELHAELPPSLRGLPEVVESVACAGPPDDIFDFITTERLREAVLRRRPELLEKLSPDERTEPLVLAAVDSQGSLLKAASPRQRDDVRIVTRAVANDGAVLSFASERLRRDPATVRAAIRRSPDALAHSLLEGEEARQAELLSIRHWGLPEAERAKLVDIEYVVAVAEHRANHRAPNCVKPREHVQFFRRHLDDPQVCERLVELNPWYYWTIPEARRTESITAAAAIAGAIRLHRTRNVSTEHWNAIARAHPERFVEAFTKHEIPEAQHAELRRALLTAVQSDHRVARKLEGQAWNDPGFVADMVRYNPLVFRSMGPARQLWLQTFEAEEVARATAQLERFDDCDFNQARFEKREWLLWELVRNRTDGRERDPRPRAVAVYPKDDHNGAFKKPKIAGLTDRYRVMYYEADDVEGLGRAIREGTRVKPAEVLMIAGHGSPSSLQLGKGTQRPDDMSRLRTRHAGELARMVPRHRLAPGARVSLMSCKTGRGDRTKRNLAVALSDIWPQTYVQAPQPNSSGGDQVVFDARRRFDHVEFRDATTDAPVPFTLLLPKHMLQRRRPVRRTMRRRRAVH